MTDSERQAIVYSTFAAIRRLVPNRYRKELEHHLSAATAAFNDQSAVQYQRGVEKGAEVATTEARELGKIEGMLAVECRADRRDEYDVKAPQELQSVH